MSTATTTTTLRPSEPMVFLHGFTQTHHHLVEFAMRLSGLTGQRSVTLVDLPGHGLSSSDRSSIADAAAVVAELGGIGDYVGYSMGGRTLLHSALLAPSRVRRLVLIGATAGIDDATERAERQAADDRLADRIETIGVDAFVEEWLERPMWANLPADPTDRVHRRRNTAAGLAHSLRTAGTGAQASLWDRLGEITQPVLIVAGEHDAKFTALGGRLAERLPHATVALVADAGHATHLERPAATAEVVASWLSTTTSDAAPAD